MGRLDWINFFQVDQSVVHRTGEILRGLGGLDGPVQVDPNAFAAKHGKIPCRGVGFLHGGPGIQVEFDFERGRNDGVIDGRRFRFKSAGTNGSPQARNLGDEPEQSILHPHHGRHTTLRRGIREHGGGRLVGMDVQDRVRIHGRGGVPNFVKHKILEEEIEKHRIGKAVIRDPLPGTVQVDAIAPISRALADVDQEMDDGRGNGGILVHGPRRRDVGAFHRLGDVGTQTFQRAGIMMLLPGVEGRIGVSTDDMQAGEAEQRMPQALIIILQDHGYNDLAERNRYVVMHGEHFAEAVIEVIEKNHIHGRFQTLDDMAQRGGDGGQLRQCIVCLRGSAPGPARARDSLTVASPLLPAILPALPHADGRVPLAMDSVVQAILTYAPSYLTSVACAGGGG